MMNGSAYTSSALSSQVDQLAYVSAGVLIAIVVVWVIISLLFAFFCGGIAAKKGYSSIGFSILGFFFGFLMVPVVAWMPKICDSPVKQTLDLEDALLKNKDLLDAGVINQAEYAQMRDSLLKSQE